MLVSDLDTPALLLDRAVLKRNLARMSARMKAHGVRLRPHLKTAKSAAVAALAHEGGGITVSTLAEARYFRQHGISDILYGVGIAPGRLDAAAELGVIIVLDSLEAARAVAAHPGPHRALIEIDCGQHRAGIPASSALLLDIARALGGKLAGVMTHAGHSYHCRSIAEVKAIAEQERQAAVAAAQRLREAGLPCPIVSAGSTPTAMHGERYDGLTEMRPGVYMFNDLDQLAIGSCGPDDLALSVLASVIGHYADRQQALVDAGALALSKDISAQEFTPQVGFGSIADPDLKGLAVNDVNQEHGFVNGAAGVPFERLALGRKLRVLPNHACITAAAYTSYHVIDSELDGGRTVVDVWERVNGW